MQTQLHNIKNNFFELGTAIFKQVPSNTYISLYINGEESNYLRFNNSNIRQFGAVNSAHVTASIIQDNRFLTFYISLTGNLTQDLAKLTENIKVALTTIQDLPADPFCAPPSTKSAESNTEFLGAITLPQNIPSLIFHNAKQAGIPVTGIYCAGRIFAGQLDNLGSKHWFNANNFFLDYSVFTPTGKAIKSGLSGELFPEEKFNLQLKQISHELKFLNKDPIKLKPGKYRSFLAPAAVAEIVEHLTYSFSEANIRQGFSPWAALKQEEKHLNPLLSLTENYAEIPVPRFNKFGETTPTILPIIATGKLENTLVSQRSNMEYGIPSNGYGNAEGLQATVIQPGKLDISHAYEHLNNGIYISNLHYLNWSDLIKGRITGMTRYSCFFIENGTIVAPIEDLRLDESLYSCLGDNLLNITSNTEFFPNINTYGGRSPGGLKVPGMLIQDFTFTL